MVNENLEYEGKFAGVATKRTASHGCVGLAFEEVIHRNDEHLLPRRERAVSEGESRRHLPVKIDLGQVVAVETKDPVNIAVGDGGKGAIVFRSKSDRVPETED